MRDSSTRSFGAVGGQSYREHQQQQRKRNNLIIGIAVISVAIVVFSVLILGEIFGWFDKKDKDENDVPLGFEFEDKMMSSEDIHKGDLILINSAFPYVFPDSPPNFLPTYTNRTQHDYVKPDGKHTTVYSYYTQSAANCAKLEPDTLKALNNMADDFFKATNNIDLFIFDEDGYRSKDDQSAYHASNPVKYVKPGETEHHTGKCVDLYVYTIDHVRGNLDDEQFAGTFKWIFDNAYKYGFVRRYPPAKEGVTAVGFEPYHFRNVGYAHAYYMFNKDLCLEEYLDLLSDTYSKKSPLQFKGDDGNNYMIYYVKASADGITNVSVPAANQENVSYTVSGDNKEGFIVTIKYK